MTHALRLAALGLICLALAGCDGLPQPLGFLNFGDRADTLPPPEAQTPTDETPRPTARPDGPLSAGPDAPGDSPDQRPQREFGTTVATLGDPNRSGLWLETPLVDREQPGRVVSETGTSVLVTLTPTGDAPGSGSRLSLDAMLILGLDLTALAPLTVFSRL